MSTLFLSRYSTPLASVCRVSLPLPLAPSPFRYSTPLVFLCLPQSLPPLSGTPPLCLIVSLPRCSLPLRVPLPICPHPPSLSLLRVPHSTCCVPFPPCSLPLQLPLPNCLFVSHLTVFPLRYPTLMPYCVPPLLLSSRTSTPPYLSFCFPPLTLSPGRYPLHLSHCVRVRPFPSPTLFLSSLTGTPP